METLKAIKAIIRADWEREICYDYDHGMVVANIALKHHIGSDEVMNVLRKYNKI